MSQADFIPSGLMADAIQEADMQLEWMDENDPITDQQRVILRNLIVRHVYGRPRDEIALRVVDGNVVYWLRDDYRSCGQVFVGELFYIIKPNGSLNSHWVPGGWRCVRLQLLINKVKRLGPVCESLVPSPGCKSQGSRLDRPRTRCPH